METVFAFDIGIASLGLAVRQGLNILHAESLILPEDTGDLSEQRSIRRQFRTREAHKAREAWLDSLCMNAGIPVLPHRIPGSPAKGIPGVKGDPRLEREFPDASEKTVYTSCLLRIKLLRGDRLEGWQVYKALRSAIQRRGYDKDITWRNRGERAEAVKEDSETLASANAYKAELSKITGNRPEWLFPCYFDAFSMGLWNPSSDSFKFRIDHHAGRARGVPEKPRSAPRELVVAELRLLLEKASGLYPKLKEQDIDSLIFGEGGVPYASHDKELRKRLGLKEGGEGDWNALLGQKIPRFDNRSPEKCVLIPRFNACRADDIAVIEATFLLKLKNMRFYNDSFRERVLSPAQIQEMLKDARIRAKSKTDDKRHSAYQITKAKWEKLISDAFKGHVMPGHDCVEAPKVSGRASLSRPAARVMRALILSGASPHAFRGEAVKEGLKDPPFDGLLEADLDFLIAMPGDWSLIHIPAKPLSGAWGVSLDVAKADEWIAKLIASQRNPKIRHRLMFLDKTLKRLASEFGAPGKVVIEFVREDFMGEERKKEFEAVQRKNRQERELAKADAEKVGARGRDELLKIRLLREQGKTCLYTGELLSESNLDELEIDHAVPRHGSFDGSDSFINKVVTKSSTNREKGDRTPFQFLTSRGNGQWLAFCERLKGISSLNRKKRLLLSSESPEELDKKWTSLAETAWIARSARDMVSLRFGWQPGEKGAEKRVDVINGQLTAAVRRRLRVDSLLAQGEADPDLIMKKNRADKRHHALDAMVLSFTPEWARNPTLRDRLIFPDGVNRELFAKAIAKVVPENVILQSPELEKTFYGKRLVDGEAMATKRVSLRSLCAHDNKFSVAKGLKNAEKIIDSKLREHVLSFLSKSPGSEAWAQWCDSASNPANGARLLAVRISDFKKPHVTEEYVDVSKDGASFRPQLKRADQNKGQFLYLDAKGKPRVVPVYAHQSLSAAKRSLEEQGIQTIGFFQSGCLIEIDKEVKYKDIVIQPGRHTLSTLRADGYLILGDVAAMQGHPISIEKFLQANFRRVK